ncbi:hypothetical protein HMPREF1983_00814 [Gemella bergeri ATCC 700627]|uniref:Uncharacterized protein n=1 Tax=Gemella bergeri ATCC 700627 TaxID=1321820 RepID=U2Q6L1_9BACL|nr:hypothetical protein HMPREF1983_00814 [Gemella bergeri ATCC 700627]
MGEKIKYNRKVRLKQRQNGIKNRFGVIEINIYLTDRKYQK